MEVRVLGPLEVVVDGRSLRLPGAKPRALLATLALAAGEAVSAERLIDELWGDDPPETAANALQVHVSQLRRALGADAVRRRPPGYELAVPPEAVDLVRFERLLETARAAEPERAAGVLREALALWRGDPEVDRPRLEELRLAALEDRIEADLALGRHGELVPELESLVAQHPLRERLRGQLMLALYRAGRQADALDAYRATRVELVEQLGIEPSPALQQLERRILAQAPELDAPQPRREDRRRRLPAAPNPSSAAAASSRKWSTSSAAQGHVSSPLPGPGESGRRGSRSRWRAPRHRTSDTAQRSCPSRASPIRR